MNKTPFRFSLTALTALSWGVYGNFLHKGTDQLGHSSIRAFIGVGIAYFLVAVLVPAIWPAASPRRALVDWRNDFCRCSQEQVGHSARLA